MAENQIKIFNSLEATYAGHIARGLPVDEALNFIFSALTPQDLAEITNRTSNYMSMIKTGKRQPTQEMQESVYNWYLKVSEMPVDSDTVQGLVPIYTADDVRTLTNLQREMMVASQALFDKYRREMTSTLRAIRSSAPDGVDFSTEVDQNVNGGVLPRRDGYTIVRTPNGTQKYERTEPDDYYNEDGDLMSVNERLLRARQKN